MKAFPPFRNKRSAPRRDLDTPVRDHLRALGIDADFLLWLEGEGDRLPRLGGLKRVTADQLVCAVRAATWLRQFSMNQELIAPTSSEAWTERYAILESFLWVVLKLSGKHGCLNKDLGALEKVLWALLPSSSWDRYKRDIHQLRRKGQPHTLPRGTRRATGGKSESEQTNRMRAAVAYLRALGSKTAFTDLADLWNESLPHFKYDSDAIKQRIRKGSQPHSQHEHWQFWHGVYFLNAEAFGQVFPGPFPPSLELRTLWTERTGLKTGWDS
jgi:hypothetical protein